jgi:PemK-like, MazF-like toxin of type II toxin-antitoxin system
MLPSPPASRSTGLASDVPPGRSSLGRMLTAVASASLGAAVRAAVRSLSRPAPTSPSHRPRTPARATPRQHRTDTATAQRHTAGAGSRSGPAISYAPHPDGLADPGEVVWTWVPYEEDATKGKDRPVLVIGRDGATLLALPLTSKDHDRDAEDEARWGRHWMDVGSGGWDSRGRPSEVRLDRVLQVHPEDVRREGAVLPQPVFDQVVAQARQINGWS